MSETKFEYHARCRCGAVQARFVTARLISEWTIGRDPIGVQSVSDPQGQLVFACDVPGLNYRYDIGAGPLEMVLCKLCDVAIGAQLMTDRGRVGTLNLAVLNMPVSLAPKQEPPIRTYPNASERRAMRVSSWTPLVTAVQ